VCVIGPVIIWSWFLIFYYARLADRSVTDYGWGGYGSLYFDWAGFPALNVILIYNWASCSLYNLNRTDWAHIEDSEKKMYEKIAFLFGVSIRARNKIRPDSLQNGKGIDVPTDEPNENNKSSTSEEQGQDLKVYYRVNDSIYRVCMLEKNVFHLLSMFTVFLVVGYYSQIAIWYLLGMFLDPNRTAPYAVAVTSLVLNITTMYKEKSTFFQEIKTELKVQMTKFHQSLKDEAAKMLQVLSAVRSVEGKNRSLTTNRAHSLSAQTGGRHSEIEEIAREETTRAQVPASVLCV